MSLVALFGFAGSVLAVPHNSGSVDAVEALVARVLGPAAQHHFSFSVVDGGCEGTAPPCYTIAGPCENHACIPFCFVRKLSTVSSRRRKRRHAQNLWVICLRADGGRGALSSTVLQHDDWLATRRGESHLCAVSMASGRWHRRTTSEQRVELHHERMHAQVVTTVIRTTRFGMDGSVSMCAAATRSYGTSGATGNDSSIGWRSVASISSSR